MENEEVQIPVEGLCRLNENFAPNYTKDQEKIGKMCANFAHKKCWKKDNECQYFHIKEVREAHDVWVM